MQTKIKELNRKVQEEQRETRLLAKRLADNGPNCLEKSLSATPISTTTGTLGGTATRIRQMKASNSTRSSVGSSTTPWNEVANALKMAGSRLMETSRKPIPCGSNNNSKK